MPKKGSKLLCPRPITTVDRVCPQCGVTFTMPPYVAPGQVFCSNICRGAHSRTRSLVLRVATCEICKIEFLKEKPSQVRRFCSRACWTASVTGVTYAQVSCVCEHCGLDFSVPQSLAKRERGRQFCSNACFNNARRSPSLTCQKCRRTFTIPRSHFGNRGQGKFCTKACFVATRATTRERKRQFATANTQRRRAREQAAAGSATVDQILARIAMFGGMCWICKMAVGTTIDHVIPLSKGGTNWPANLRPACKSCNSKKRDRSYKVFPGVAA